MSSEVRASTNGYNPLQELPSMLALRDLRAALSQGDRSSTKWTSTLLRVDPLTVLRCLRAARTGLYAGASGPETIPQLCDGLGPAAIRRAFDRKPVATSGTDPLRQLWLHTLASAHAASALAESVDADSEVAFVRAIVSHLDGWLELLSLHASGSAAPWSAEGWQRAWNLPTPGLAEPSTPTDPLVAARAHPDQLSGPAAAIACLAGFDHPLKTIGIRHPSPAANALAMNVYDRVRRSLNEVGLGHAIGGDEGASPQTAVTTPSQGMFGGQAQSSGSQLDLINSLIACNRASSYRGVLLAGSAAALRFLDFDRALVVRWNRNNRQAWVRIKYDMSRLRLQTGIVRLDSAEEEAFLTSLEEERPAHLTRRGDDDGLLATIGADSALAAPMNRIFEVPTFLILDRALTARPVRLHEDIEATSALSSLFTLLADNLLLRLQRIRAQRTALTDPLTRLANRRIGMLEFEREFALAKRDDLPLSVLMLDLDDFKNLNDTYGHMVGDQALQLTARVLRGELRRSDVICRYGGEEFFAVLPHTEGEDAAVLATRLYLAVEEAGRRYRLPVTVSIGAATLKEEDADASDLLHRADRALYASKNTGRNRFSLDAD